jgi:hypothetical protein
MIHVGLELITKTIISFSAPVETSVHAEYYESFGNKDVGMIAALVSNITQPDDVIVEVIGSAICGFDLLYLRVVRLKMGSCLLAKLIERISFGT